MQATGLLDEAYAGMVEAATPYCERLNGILGSDEEVTDGNQIGLLVSIAARHALASGATPDGWLRLAVETWNSERWRQEERQSAGH